MTVNLLVAAPAVRLAIWRTALEADPRYRVIPAADKRGLIAGLTARPPVLLLDASLFNGLPDLQATLTPIRDTAVYAVLPAVAGAAEVEATRRLPNVRAVFQSEVEIEVLLHEIAGSEEPPPAQPVSVPSAPSVVPAPVAVPPAAPTSLPRQAVRLGFWGTRGGVGVSTAVVDCGRLLADSGPRIALFDATGRGDLHLLLGREPQPEPLVVGAITIFMGPPDEGQTADFEAVIVDGGRHKGTFNAEWIEVSRPIAEEALRQRVGLSADTPRRFGLGRLRIEVG